ncbi:MAG: D-glycero-beta-D-manno-heptose 1-phosphate adenylyltransferase [Candidatus Binatia bacterium]
MSSTKYHPVQALAGIVAQLRQSGQRIVFTNGCFDILHPGHIHTLSQAKCYGDVLIVGINSDDSVRRLKGERRPILNQTERAVMLAALETVDYVTTFNEDTPLELIRLLQPHVLVKGGDWQTESVVGKELVEANGGQVVVVPYQVGFSTTGIIERILTVYGSSAQGESSCPRPS